MNRRWYVKSYFYARFSGEKQKAASVVMTNPRASLLGTRGLPQSKTWGNRKRERGPAVPAPWDNDESEHWKCFVSGRHGLPRAQSSG